MNNHYRINSKEENAPKHSHGSWYTFWQIKQRCYNRVQKQVRQRYLLFLISNWWFDFINWLLNIIFSLKSKSVIIKLPDYQFWRLTVTPPIFPQIFTYAKLHILKLKLLSKQYYKINFCTGL